MSSYPGTLDSFNVIGTANYMDEAGYVLHNHLNDHGSAVVAIQETLGTNAGTSVLKDFVAGNFPVRANSGGTLQQELSLGTIRSTQLRSPIITDGGGTSIFTLNQPGTANQNSFEFSTAQTGSAPKFNVRGVDSNIDMDIDAKGTGVVDVSSNRLSVGARRGKPFNLENMGTVKSVYFAQGETQHGTLDSVGTCTITFGSINTGDYLTLFLTQGTAGDCVIEFGGTVHAPDNTALEVGTAANVKNVLGFRVDPVNADIVHWVASQINMGTF